MRIERLNQIIADVIIIKSDEILLSNKSIDELGIILEKVGEEPWRFKDGPPSKKLGEAFVLKDGSKILS